VPLTGHGGSSPPSDTFTSPTHGPHRHTDCFRLCVVGHFQPKGLVQLGEKRRIGVVEQRRDLAQRLDQRIYVKCTNTRAKRLVIKS
jgi:hypothetical protein